MSELDDIMQERIAYIVFHEHKPFSHRDFLDIMKPKTYRNKICRLKKDGIVELDYNSGIAFYTLKGYKRGKLGTTNHIGVPSTSIPTSITISHNDPVYQMIKNLPMDRQGIHDIRLKFEVPNIYETFRSLSVTADFAMAFHKDDISKDIRLPYWNINNAIVQIRIHKTNTVSVIVACSRKPFSFDYKGIIRFFTTLADIHGLLVGLTFSNEKQTAGLTVTPSAERVNMNIPRYQSWIITTWHFGRDALTIYKGEKYEITVENAQHIFTRLYTKDYG